MELALINTWVTLSTCFCTMRPAPWFPFGPTPCNSTFLSRYPSKVTYVLPHLQAAWTRNGVMPKWLLLWGRGEVRLYVSMPTVLATEPLGMPAGVAEWLNVDSFPINKLIVVKHRPLKSMGNKPCPVCPQQAMWVTAANWTEGNCGSATIGECMQSTQGTLLECLVLVTIWHQRLSSVQHHDYKNQKM